MFDTMKVARKIKTARTARNMTQMALADEMGVSYQAVSNWERGNSMPDIAKLEDLCRVLEISISDLLGADAPAAAAVEKTLDAQENLTVEELAEIAPILPPDRVEETVRKSAAGEGKPLNIQALGSIAPFLDEEYLDELAENAQVGSLAELVGIAPFLSEKTLDTLVKKARDLTGIVALAPFLGDSTLDNLAADPNLGRKTMIGLAPFFSDKALDALAANPDLDKKAMDRSGAILQRQNPGRPGRAPHRPGRFAGDDRAVSLPQQRHIAKAGQNADGKGGLGQPAGGFCVPLKPYSGKNTRNIYIKH